MARVEVTFCQAGGTSTESSAPTQVAKLSNMATEVVTSSGTSAKTTLSSTAAGASGFVMIYAATDVWAVAGPTSGLAAVIPTSGQNKPGQRIRGLTLTSFAVNHGDVVAVIDVTAL